MSRSRRGRTPRHARCKKHICGSSPFHLTMPMQHNHVIFLSPLSCMGSFCWRYTRACAFFARGARPLLPCRHLIRHKTFCSTSHRRHGILLKEEGGEKDGNISALTYLYIRWRQKTGLRSSWMKTSLARRHGASRQTQAARALPASHQQKATLMACAPHLATPWQLWHICWRATCYTATYHGLKPRTSGRAMPSLSLLCLLDIGPATTTTPRGQHCNLPAFFSLPPATLPGCCSNLHSILLAYIATR